MIDNTIIIADAVDFPFSIFIKEAPYGYSAKLLDQNWQMNFDIFSSKMLQKSNV